MKNTAQNTLGYTGVVTISRYQNNKKIELAKVYNTGRSPLFDFLADCLLGDFDSAAQTRPTKIMLLKAKALDSGGISVESSASGFIALMTTPEKIITTTSGGVRYSFILTKDQVTDTEFTGIGLYTKAVTDFNEFAAYCDISESSLNINSLPVSSALIIDWELIISDHK